MKIFVTGKDLGDIGPEMQKALDTALARTLALQQGALAKANPKDTGRMASSWFISHNQPSDEVRPDGWAESEAQRVEIEEYPQNEIAFGGTWYISNNVPYAIYTALNYEPKAPKAQKDWYTSIQNQSNNVFNKQYRDVEPK